MKQHTLSILILASITGFYGCSSDDNTTEIPQIGDACETKANCPADADCIHSVCTKPEENNCGELNCTETQKCIENKCMDLCGNEVCTAQQHCVENKCMDLCGNEVCTAQQQCVENKCMDLCGNEVCTAQQQCVENKCMDLCGNEACTAQQQCVENKCMDLCGEDICSEDEICDGEKCLPKGDCGGIQCTDNQYCSNDLCLDKVKCGDIYCEGGYECVENACVPGAFCIDGTPRCGENCCTNSQFCGTRKQCCEKAEACGQNCCSDSEVCEHEMCHKKCETDSVRCEDSNGVEMCCNADEMCVSNQCFKPTVSCIDDYVCENDQFCDSVLKTCVPSPDGDACEISAKGGEVEPTLLWYWGEKEPETFPKYNQVMSTPMVADINNDTIPEVVFNSYLTGADGQDQSWIGNGIVRVLNGQTGELIVSSDGVPFTDGGSNVAIGNLDDDPYLEIVTCDDAKHLVAFKFVPGDSNTQTKDSLNVFWRSQATYNECYMHGPGIADFNGDGKPEVFGRYTVHNGQTGEIIAHEACGDTHTIWAPCDYSAAADINGDGIQELIGGNVVYNVDFENKVLKPLWKRDDMPDGYPAIANLDLDTEGKPELVVVQTPTSPDYDFPVYFAKSLMVFDAATGNNFWQQPIEYGLGNGGAPTIANMDDTPEPEIAFAGKNGNMVFDYQGKQLWKRNSNDVSSGFTGSTVFDFDGDGKAEVVYADEYFLRVYDGITGNTRYCAYNTNCTLFEYPVVVDVNGDDHAEIIISSNTSCDLNTYRPAFTEANGLDDCISGLLNKGDAALVPTHGVRAFASPNHDWVNTRKIYNQHAYSITNISDNGSIPQKLRSNWNVKNLNNFRQNVQPGASYLPDLAIKDVSTPYDCSKPLPIYFRVENVGWATADKGIKVYIWAATKEDGEYKQIGTVETTEQLRASNSEYLKFDYNDMATSGAYIKLTFGEDAPKECRTDNNTTKYVIQCPVN